MKQASNSQFAPVEQPFGREPPMPRLPVWYTDVYGFDYETVGKQEAQ